MAVAATSTIGTTMIKTPTEKASLPFGLQRSTISSPVASSTNSSSGSTRSGDAFYCATCGGSTRTGSTFVPGKTSSSSSGTYTTASICPTCSNTVGRTVSLGGSGSSSTSNTSATSTSNTSNRYSSIGGMITSGSSSGTTTAKSTGYKWF